MAGARGVVVFFQRALSRRQRTVPELLDRMEGEAPEARAIAAPDALQPDEVAFANELFTEAMQDVGLTQDRLSEQLRISPELLSRQRQNKDNQHLSFQRIVCRGEDDFLCALVLRLIEAKKLGKVRRCATVEFEL